MTDVVTEAGLKLPKNLQYGGKKQIIFVVDETSFFKALTSKFYAFITCRIWIFIQIVIQL